MRFISVLIPFAFLLASACSGAPEALRDATVRDSAGVRIVENTNAADRASGWTIGETPVFRIGWAEDDPQFQQLTYGRMRSDGTAIVADERASILYFVPPEGAPVRSLGRRGEGPGEFGAIAGVLPLGADSLLVADTRNNRVSILDESGSPLVEMSYQPGRGFARYAPDGRVNGEFVLIPVMQGGSRDAPEGWDQRPVFRTTDFADWHVIAEHPLWYDQGPGPMNPVMHFGRVRAGPHGIVHLQTDRPAAFWYGLDGSLLQIARWDAAVRDVNDADWTELEEGVRAQGNIPAERLEETLETWRRGFGGLVPQFGMVHVDGSGNVWMGDSGFFTRAESRFNVISADGVWLGAIDFPAPVLVLDITETQALVVESNSLDVQAIALYDIARPVP